MSDAVVTVWGRLSALPRPGLADLFAAAPGRVARLSSKLDLPIPAAAMGEVKSLIHIGVGGSVLGPALAVDALSRDGVEVDVHVVSTIDGLALEAACAACDPQTTMIAVSSKTSATTETMT